MRPFPVAWMKGLGTAGGFAESVAVRADGSLILAGRGRPTGWTKRPPSKRTAAFIAALDASGGPAWAVELEAADATARAVLALSDGSAIACGDFKGTLRVAGATLATAAGESDVFVLALGPDGKLRWSTSAGGAGYDSCADVAALPDGRIVIAGSVGANAKLGPLTARSQGDGDAFVAQLDATGAPRWVATGGSAEQDDARALAVTSDAIYVTGAFGGAATFGGHALPLPAQTARRVANPSNMFVARYSFAGDTVWATRFGAASAFDRGWAIAALSDGGVAVAGQTEGRMFVARYSAAGTQRWIRTARGDSSAQALLALPDDDVLVAGYFGWPQGGPDLELSGTTRKLELRAMGSATVIARYSGAGELLAAGLLMGDKSHSPGERDGTEVEIMDMARSPAGRIAMAGRLWFGVAMVSPGDLFVPTTARITVPSEMDTTAVVVLDPP
ncbi:MAG TPA: hypothetical protein VN253_23935 [Kofleriaceae bacterium]|nr:hypothetical protein [Kofleriaceae bacterium]